MFRIVAFLGVLLSVPCVAMAQFVVPFYYQPYYGPYYPYPYGGTAAGQYLHGLGNAFRSMGQASRAYGDYLVDREQARQHYLENWQRWQELRAAQQRAARAERLAAYERQREAYRKWKAMYYDDGPTASAENLPPVVGLNGEINWPGVLQRHEFDGYRERLERLFAQRAESGLDRELAYAIQDTILAMQRELRDQIEVVNTRDFIDARRFLDRLAIEGRTTPGY